MGLMPLKASALQTGQIAKAGISWTGMAAGSPWVVTDPFDGSACTFISLGGSTGLSDNYDIYGTDFDEEIAFAYPA